MNRLLRNAFISTIVSIVAAWSTAFPISWYSISTFSFPVNCLDCTGIVVYHPFNFLQDFVFWFVVFFTVLSVATINAKLDERTMRVIKSPSLSLGAGAAIFFGLLYSLRVIALNTSFFQLANDYFLVAILGWITVTIFIAIRCATFLVRELNYTRTELYHRLARNSAIAVIAGFVLIYALAGYGANETQLFNEASLLFSSGVIRYYTFLYSTTLFWNVPFLVTYLVPFWSSVAFLIISVFSFDRARDRNKQAEANKISADRKIGFLLVSGLAMIFGGMFVNTASGDTVYSTAGWNINGILGIFLIVIGLLCVTYSIILDSHGERRTSVVKTA